MADLLDYEMFVDGKTSQESRDFDEMIQSLTDLHETGMDIGVRIPQLITASVGISAEAGEFTEIVKKMIFQGKPLNMENKIHLQKELGDILFYAMVACTALGITADEVIEMNKEKLDKRYAAGFTVDESENRTVEDI